VTKIPVCRQFLFGDVVSTLNKMNVDVGSLLRRFGLPDWQYNDAMDAIPLAHFLRFLWGAGQT